MSQKKLEFKDVVEFKEIRTITVERCSCETCPHCIPDKYKTTVNYCGALEDMPEISAKVKTFPKLCPLYKTRVPVWKKTR